MPMADIAPGLPTPLAVDLVADAKVARAMPEQADQEFQEWHLRALTEPREGPLDRPGGGALTSEYPIHGHAVKVFLAPIAKPSRVGDTNLSSPTAEHRPLTFSDIEGSSHRGTSALFSVAHEDLYPL